MIAVLLVVVGPTAVVELLMMGMRMPEICSAVFKLQVINLSIYKYGTVTKHSCRVAELA